MFPHWARNPCVDTQLTPPARELIVDAAAIRAAATEPMISIRIARAARALAVLACIAAPLSASAQATAGRASSIVLPVVAKTGSLEAEMFVCNPNTFAIDVDVLYYEANNLAAAGFKACAMLSALANSVVPLKFGTQRPVLADAASHFGLLVLRDHAT